MFDLAIVLINKGMAYVCHQTASEMRSGRKATSEARIQGQEVPVGALSPWRNSSVEENLEKFMKMRDGGYLEGEACMRMKGDFSSDNPAMWDPVFYRIKHSPPHPRSGSVWKIYPTYDFSHCIVDSLEGITHSCCTLEFAGRQAPDGPYYWVLWALGLYKPVTWEYSRCSIADNVLSKRRLQQLVEKRLVEGWDDPRLLTLAGLRRRGYTPSIINRFCEQIGVSTAQVSTTHMHVLESIAREEFDVSAFRAFAVLEPLKVSIVNYQDIPKLVNITDSSTDGSVLGYVSTRNHPKNESLGVRKVALGATIFIEKKDFSMTGSGDYYGLVPDGAVGLLGTGFSIVCEEVVKDKDGHPSEIKVRAVSRKEKKPKGNIHWIADCAHKRAKVRTYGSLLLPKPDNEVLEIATEDGGELATGEDWLSSVNPTSLHEIDGALLEPSIEDGKVYQFMRSGYFTKDPCSSASDPVYHQIVPLKSSYSD
mmetsp:Transcript_44752/g.70058  ORF Transcript_44752/g.70058 Transcript_44752/m.70058 type:complete len:479 (+) Transcript_44752:511-1947(+)